MITAIQRLRPWRRVQAGCDEERQADEDQHRAGLEQQLDQGDDGDDARGGLHADHEGGAGVQRPARLAEGALLALGLGFHERLADRVVLGYLVDAR
jgi:hypothetical protein